jgi:hypothetical protein
MNAQSSMHHATHAVTGASQDSRELNELANALYAPAHAELA